MRRIGLLVICVLTILPVIANAQRELVGQIFMPNGSPPARAIRFTLTYNNGMRTEVFFSDSNGRIVLPNISGVFTITIDSDGQTYDTTSRTFDTRAIAANISIQLRPLKTAAQPPASTVAAPDVDSNVSQKAREKYQAALALIKEEKYEQAVEPLKQAIAAEKKYFTAHSDLGVLYMKLGKNDLAEATLKEAIKINDQIDLPYINLALLLNRQGRYKEAADELLKYQQRFPNSSGVYAPLIEALIESQQWAEAETVLTKALESKGLDVVDLKTKLGLMQIRQGKFDAAVTTLREATAAEPDNAEALFNFGLALLQAGNLDEAEKPLLRAYELRGSKMPGAQIVLGQLYFQKKDYEKALVAFETYLRDLPDAPNAAQVREAVRQLREATGKKP
ncbi:MAG TPA: tetratricopeptide repeat protein [Blastocatellia bacterium]|nr:tetratricopeptide repeat protein [Blastocatellia bacterium]